jgi:acetyl esterase
MNTQVWFATVVSLFLVIVGSVPSALSQDAKRNPAPAPAAPAGKPFVYKQGSDTELKLYGYFPAGWEASKQYPTIVFFFGGGWSSGRVTQFEPQAQHLASRGMVAFCADYRVKSRHDVSPDACVEDAKSAIRYVRQNAAKLGVDPNKIVAAGGSAGGHIAACTALCPGLDAKDEAASISSKPNALVLYNPVLDFNERSLSARVGNDADLVKLISPTLHLTADTPPTWMTYGKDDRLLAHGEAFLAKSKKLGHRTEIMLVDGVGHGFFNRPPHQAATTARMDAFLVSLGYLPPVAPESTGDK